MEINDLLRKSEIDLRESILILSKLLDVDRAYIYTYGNNEVSDDVVSEFIDSTNRRKEGYPIQYILKERNFMGMDFFVDEGVLVPRSDTEVLIEYIIKYVEENYDGEDISILDIGVGSGAISLSLGHYLKNSQITGVDISEDALKIANINKKKFSLENIEFLQGDLFEPIENLNKKYNIIVSNPPYIKTGVIETLDSQVRDYEPMIALDGGIDGLDFYRKIVDNSQNYLLDGGLLAFEIGYDQGDEVRELLLNTGYEDILILKDIQGHDRVVLGRLYK